ncbi:MAG: hypothetical protein ACK4P3_03630 [Fimbriimonadaceae bacterium]
MTNFILLGLLSTVVAQPPSHEAFPAPVAFIRYSPDGSRVADLSISPDNSLLSYGSQDKTIRVV